MKSKSFCYESVSSEKPEIYTVYDNVRAALELRALDFQRKIKTHNDASNDEALRIQTSLAETMTTVKTDNIPKAANGMMEV